MYIFELLRVFDDCATPVTRVRVGDGNGPTRSHPSLGHGQGLVSHDSLFRRSILLPEWSDGTTRWRTRRF